LEAAPGLEPGNNGFESRSGEAPSDGDQASSGEKVPSIDPPSEPDQLDALLSVREGGDPELALVVRAWPALPEALRAGIVAIASTVGTHGASPIANPTAEGAEARPAT